MSPRISEINLRSGNVLGPTCRISASRAMPSRTWPAKMSSREGRSDIPDRSSGVWDLCPVTSLVDSDSEPVLVLVLSVISTSPDNPSFSESEMSLILKNKIFTFSDVLALIDEADLTTSPRQLSAVLDNSRCITTILRKICENRGHPTPYL